MAGWRIRLTEQRPANGVTCSDRSAQFPVVRGWTVDEHERETGQFRLARGWMTSVEWRAAEKKAEPSVADRSDRIGPVQRAKAFSEAQRTKRLVESRAERADSPSHCSRHVDSEWRRRRKGRRDECGSTCYGFGRHYQTGTNQQQSQRLSVSQPAGRTERQQDCSCRCPSLTASSRILVCRCVQMNLQLTEVTQMLQEVSSDAQRQSSREQRAEAAAAPAVALVAGGGFSPVTLVRRVHACRGGAEEMTQRVWH